MVYFILWALLFLAIVVSVPVVNMLEKRKRLAMLEPDPSAEIDETEPGDDIPEADGFGEVVDAAEDDDDLAGFDQ